MHDDNMHEFKSKCFYIQSKVKQKPFDNNKIIGLMASSAMHITAFQPSKTSYEKAVKKSA